MDRQQAVNNQQLQAKGLATSDGLPNTSRSQLTKHYSRPNKQQQGGNRSGFARNQNKHQLPPQRGHHGHHHREPKPFAQESHFRDNLDSSRSYLADTRLNSCRRKKPTNNGKVSIKERFVQANCQFVMSALNDNAEHLADPDAPVNWELVEEVVFTCTNNELCCPICLCVPTAPKITRCGHIYCWSCVLHYLALSDKESRACPICFETVQKAELKAVCIINKIEYAMNDHLTFSLMKIRKNSTLALPAHYEPEQPLHRLKRNTSQTLDQFGKFYIATSEYLAGLFEREKRELAEQLLEYARENMPEIIFIQSALEELEAAESKLQFNSPVTALCNQFAELNDLLLSDSHNADDFVYFYQSEDGQSIFLHPLNVRMLKHEFGELRNCPANITAKIIDLQWNTVHEDLRRRFAHMRHLPSCCEIKIAEVELDTSVVSQATLDEFALEINNRKKSRKRKEKAQKIRDRKIEIENKRKIYGISPAPTFQLDNAADFPVVHLASSSTENDIWSAAIEPTSSPEPQMDSSTPLSSLSAAAEFQSSFAKMLSTGSGHNFDNTLRKKPTTTMEPSQSNSADNEDEAEAEAVTMQSMNITLGDFFDNCIKTKTKKKKARKPKK